MRDVRLFDQLILQEIILLIDDGRVNLKHSALLRFHLAAGVWRIDAGADQVNREFGGVGGVLVDETERDAEKLVHALRYADDLAVHLFVHQVVLEVQLIQVAQLVGPAVGLVDFVQEPQELNPVFQRGHQLRHQIYRNYEPVAILRHDQPVPPQDFAPARLQVSVDQLVVDFGKLPGHEHVHVLELDRILRVPQDPGHVVVDRLDIAQVRLVAADRDDGRVAVLTVLHLLQVDIEILIVGLLLDVVRLFQQPKPLLVIVDDVNQKVAVQDERANIVRVDLIHVFVLPADLFERRSDLLPANLQLSDVWLGRLKLLPKTMVGLGALQHRILQVAELLEELEYSAREGG